MDIEVFTLCAGIPGDPNPCLPQVFGTYAEAEAAADRTLREEWDNYAPCDDELNPIPYPGAWDEADRLLAIHQADTYGRWEISSHRVLVMTTSPT